MEGFIGPLCCQRCTVRENGTEATWRLANLFGFGWPIREATMSEQQPFEWGDWARRGGARTVPPVARLRRKSNLPAHGTSAPTRPSPQRSPGTKARRKLYAPRACARRGRRRLSDLLTLAAAAESPGDADTATAAEIDRKLTKLIRSPDGGISLKAIEAHKGARNSGASAARTPDG